MNIPLVLLCLSTEVLLTMNVRFRWFLAVLLALCLGVPSSGWASSDIKKIVLATDTIDGLVEKDGSGLYVDILSKIFAAQSIELNIMIVPQSRAYLWTANGNADAMLSARQNEVEGLYFPVWHYDITFVSAMFKKDRFKDWQGEYSLQNRSVGTLRGANYNNYLYVPIDLQQVTQRIEGVKMLKLDRLDFFLDNRKALQQTLIANATELSKMNFDPQQYQIENIVPVKQYIAFTDNAKGRELAQIFDAGFAKLLASGELEALFIAYNYLPFPFPQNID
jgi:polar amino acid transport system substrate-binding protein